MPSLKELENLKTILLGEKAANVLGGISKYKEILAAFRETYDKEKADGYIVISQKLFRSREQELADRTYNECYSIYKGFSDRKKEGIESVLKTSYYTPEAVVTGVKKALNTYLQNTKGSIRILEPSAGDGSFIKPFLTDKSMKTSCFAVEKCPLAFERLQKNIPPINKEGKMIMSPYNDPFEQLYFDSFTFDLVLGNFPFGDFKPALAKGQNPYKEFDNNIQNFFILKSLQHLRNGGLMVFLCSDRFADNNKNLAKEVFKKANFIGGLRLHNEIFKKENTKVVSDIVMLQKNENKTQITEIEKEFLEEYTFPSKNDPEKTLRISKYFKKQMFGELDEGFFNYQYNPTVRNAFANQEPAFTENFIADTLSMALKKAFDKKIFQENLFFKEPPKAPPKAIKKEKEATPPNHFQNFVLKNYPNIKKGNLLFWNEKLVHLKNEKENAFDYEPILEPIFAKPSKRKKIGTGQLAFFDNAGEPAQKNLQLNKEETIFYEDFINLTQKYNEQESEKGDFDKTYFIKNHYATFFKKHGPLKNHLPKIQKDFHHKTLLNIEKNKSIFEENQTKTPLQKAALPKQPPTIEEILEDSYDKFNCVNVDFVNTMYLNIYGNTNWMKAALKNKNVFLNPVYDRVGVFQKVELASKNDFLSGMLFKKINFLKTDFLKYLEKQGNITILKDFDFLNGETLQVLKNAMIFFLFVALFKTNGAMIRAF